jgi:hypothetical protein
MSDQGMEHRHHHKHWAEWSTGAKVALVLGIIIAVPSLAALCGAVTMWLWNALMPAIFNLPAIGFWQALGLLVLSQILFKGGHVGRAGRSHWKRRQVWKHMREDEETEAAKA